MLNDSGREFVLLEATQDGYVELFRGNYERARKEYEQAYERANNEIYGNLESLKGAKGADSWDLQFSEDGRYDDGNGEQIGSEGIQGDFERSGNYLLSSDQRKSVKFQNKQDRSATKTFSEAMADTVSQAIRGRFLD